MIDLTIVCLNRAKKFITAASQLNCFVSYRLRSVTKGQFVGGVIKIAFVSHESHQSPA